MKVITKATRNRLILLAVAVALFLIYLFVPSVNAFVGKAAAVLGSGKIETVIEYIRSYGPQAMVISFFLMVFSSVIAPLPAFMITLSNAAIFGWWQGAILAWAAPLSRVLRNTLKSTAPRPFWSAVCCPSYPLTQSATSQV